MVFSEYCATLFYNDVKIMVGHSPEAEHGLDADTEEHDAQAGEDELGPGVEHPAAEQQDHAHVPSIAAGLGTRCGEGVLRTTAVRVV